MAKIQDVIQAYIHLRDKVDEIKKRQTEELRPLRDKMATLEGWLLNQMQESGASSFSCEFGTAFQSVRTSSKVEDWEEALAFIRKEELWHMLERRVAKTAVEEYLEANGELPPGISVSRDMTVNIRRK